MDPLEVFKENMERARICIGLGYAREVKTASDVLGFGESITEFMRNRPRVVPLIDGAVNFIIDYWEKQLAPFIESQVKKLYELGLPQTLVFIVSCLEAYLKDNYSLITSNEVKKSLLNIKNIQRTYGRLIKGDILGGDEELRKDLEEIFQKRHVIVHNGGIIDKKAREKVEKWDDSMIGQQVTLNSHVVEEHLARIEEFVALVNHKLEASQHHSLR